MQRALLSATVLSGLSLAGFSSGAHAKEVWLAAIRTCVLPSGANGGNCTVPAVPANTDPVPVWSFVQISSDEYASGTPAAATLANAVVPGPLLTADSTDTSGLTVHLLNLLPVPVSMVIPGLLGAAAPAPVWIDSKTGNVTGTGKRPDLTSRVRSLDYETAPNSKMDYKWPTLAPGSYLYETGTHQAIQVQMGLHGPLIVANGTTTANQASGSAYPGVTYAQQVSTYLSEIDAAMHRTVDASPTHDATPAGSAASVSPLKYWPNIFLTSQMVLNADQTVSPAAQIAQNQPTLMRFFNGTLRSHVQVVQNQNLAVVAEDAQAYRYAKNQYSVLLDAGKTKDALMLPAKIEHVAVYDRMLNTGNAGNTRQGLLAGFDVTAISMPTAYNDKYTGAYGVPLTVSAKPNTTGPQGVLFNDKSHDGQTLSAAVVTNPQYGSLTLNADGTFTYTPTVGSNKLTDSFTYKASETVGGVKYTSQQATVSLSFTATAPVAANDTYYVTTGNSSTASTSLTTIAATGVLANDTPAGGSAVVTTGPNGPPPPTGSTTPPPKPVLTLAPDGSFNYKFTGNYVYSDSFTYGVTNPAGTSAATATINVLAKPVTSNFTVSVTRPNAATITIPGASATVPVTSTTLSGVGSATVISPTQIQYTPPATVPGTKPTIAFTIKNLAGTTASGTVTLTIK